MKSIATIFWNASDRRPRAGWRLLLQFLICLLVIVAALLSISAIAIGQIVDTPPEFAKWEIIIESLATLPAIWLGARLLDRRRFADLGLHLSKDWAVDFGFGLGLGALLVSGIFLVQLAAGWVTVTGTFVTRDPSHSRRHTASAARSEGRVIATGSQPAVVPFGIGGDSAITGRIPLIGRMSYERPENAVSSPSFPAP